MRLIAQVPVLPVSTYDRYDMPPRGGHTRRARVKPLQTPDEPHLRGAAGIVPLEDAGILQNGAEHAADLLLRKTSGLHLGLEARRQDGHAHDLD